MTLHPRSSTPSGVRHATVSTSSHPHAPSPSYSMSVTGSTLKKWAHTPSALLLASTASATATRLSTCAASLVLPLLWTCRCSSGVLFFANVSCRRVMAGMQKGEKGGKRLIKSLIDSIDVAYFIILNNVYCGIWCAEPPLVSYLACLLLTVFLLAQRWLGCLER